MRYQMGCVELIGWMILGGFLGAAILSIAGNAIEGPPLDWGTGVALYFLSIVIGAAVPIVVFCRGKWQ